MDDTVKRMETFVSMTPTAMDDTVKRLETVVTNFEKRIDTLSWKIKKLEGMLFPDKGASPSCKVMSMMSKFTSACNKFEELLKLFAVHDKEQEAYIDKLQLQVNIVKSKVETLRALMTKGKTIEF